MKVIKLVQKRPFTTDEIIRHHYKELFDKLNSILEVLYANDLNADILEQAINRLEESESWYEKHL